MSNIFNTLPNDLVNEIFTKCAIFSDNSGSKQYVKYKVINNTLYKYDYVGDMGCEGTPHGHGMMSSSSCNTNLIHSNTEIETKWLYVPFLYIFKNYNPLLNSL